MLIEFPNVNRSLLVIQFKQPYLDWANQLPDPPEKGLPDPQVFENFDQEPRAYLIPEIFDEDELEAFFERMWISLFESLLADRVSDEKHWPKKRTMKMFANWFELSFTSTVSDLWSKEPLEHV